MANRIIRVCFVARKEQNRLWWTVRTTPKWTKRIAKNDANTLIGLLAAFFDMTRSECVRQAVWTWSHGRSPSPKPKCLALICPDWGQQVEENWTFPSGQPFGLVHKYNLYTWSYLQQLASPHEAELWIPLRHLRKTLCLPWKSFRGAVASETANSKKPLLLHAASNLQWDICQLGFCANAHHCLNLNLFISSFSLYFKPTIDLRTWSRSFSSTMSPGTSSSVIMARDPRKSSSTSSRYTLVPTTQQTWPSSASFASTKRQDKEHQRKKV